MKTLIATVEGCEIWHDTDAREVFWKARARIDVDGSGKSHGDPYFQADTSLHWNGRALDSDVDLFIVVHPSIIAAVPGVVLGCQAVVEHRGRMTLAVCGDIGPRLRLGEMSRACAIALGIDPDPNRGGVDEPVVMYRIRPGVQASVVGKVYQLKPSH